MDIKDEIARCRAEVKHFRGLAKFQREIAASAKSNCDWLAKLKAMTGRGNMSERRKATTQERERELRTCQ